MIKPEQIKQVETTREAIVKGLVDSTIDAMLLEEAQGYNGAVVYNDYTDDIDMINTLKV